jgi:hypothetical protein
MMSPRGQGAPTPTRPIRVDLKMWERAGEATKAQGTDRSTIIREFLHWYLREPGAKLPARPDRQVSE